MPKVRTGPMPMVLQFVTPRFDGAGRPLDFYHQARTDGSSPRTPITEPGFLCRGQDDWDKADLFFTWDAILRTPEAIPGLAKSLLALGKAEEFMGVLAKQLKERGGR
jgi:hypothetical protein